MLCKSDRFCNGSIYYHQINYHPKIVAKRKISESLSALNEKYPNWKCTIENWREKAEEFRNQQRGDGSYDEDSGLTLLQRRWEAGIGRDEQMCYEIVASCETPVQALFQCLEYGLIPPPEILMVLDEMFRSYDLFFGELTLEEVFFGKPVKGQGTYAARRYTGRRRKFSYVNFTNWMKKNTDVVSKLSVPKLAERYLTDPNVLKSQPSLEKVEVDSFVRQYRRWKKEEANHE